MIDLKAYEEICEKIWRELQKNDEAVITACQCMKEAVEMLRKASCKLDEAAETIRAMPESYRVDALTFAAECLANDAHELMKKLEGER